MFEENHSKVDSNLPPEKAPKKKKCPRCTKKMSKRISNEVQTFFSPIYTWYWHCKCGYEEVGGRWSDLLSDLNRS